MNGNKVTGDIISELGQIAKDVGTQTAKIPGDIAGKAMESLGASSGVKSSTAAPPVAREGGAPTAWQQIGTEKDIKIRRAIARKALEELAGGGVAKPREPSIWERLQMEQEQKKNTSTQQQAAASQSLPMATSKRPRGDLYGAKAKKTATENRNVRQD